MSYEEMRRPLRTLRKAELVEYLVSVVNLLTNNIDGEGAYNRGWGDSRKCILDVSGLATLYDIDLTMED